MDEEYRTGSNFHCCINIVEIRVPCAPKTIQCRYDLVMNAFDIEIDNFSIGIAQYLMVDRLIIKVRFKRTRSGSSTYTDKKHYGIGADILAIEWGIRPDKANHTLQHTTQDNVRSALKPLTRRYRIDLLYQRLHILNCRFYTDTLFTKYKSIFGNTCAHIFTDG